LEIFSLEFKKARNCYTVNIEAKFIADTTIVDQALWLRKILNDLHLEQEMTIEVMVDNQVATAI